MRRLLSEEELEQASASVADPWLALAAEANGIGFFNWNVIDGHLRWNSGAEERMGLEPGAISSFEQWQRFAHPDDARRIAEDVAQLAVTHAPRLSYTYRFTPTDGQTRIMEGIAQCLYDRHGTLRRIVGVNVDITERELDRRALAEASEKLEDLRAQFLRSARLTAMGEVAAGLAHELNQPLSAATNYIMAAEISALASRQPQQAIAHLQAAKEQVTRTGDIIRRLRGFLSEEEKEPHATLMREVIEEAILLALPSSERSRIVVEIELRPSDITVFADRVQILQVLVNLIRNAAEAMQGIGEGPRHIRITGSTVAGAATFSVEDTGTGFAEHVLSGDYRPFVSTKGAIGMGLGLSISRRIIESQHGAIALENRDGTGAKVTFTLPLAAELS